MRTRVYVEMSGGLGNQMFQYAFGRYLENTFGYNIVFLTKSYKKDELRDVSITNFNIDKHWNCDENISFYSSHPFRCFVLKAWNKIDQIHDKVFGASYIKPSRFYIFKHHCLNRMGVFTHSSSKYLLPYASFCKEGYAYGGWHTALYADRIKDMLKKELVLKHTIEVPQSIYEMIKNTDSVCVHIRRGDYTNYSYYLVCDIEYYKKAIAWMKQLRPSAKFFVFSDDIEWVKARLHEDVIYIEEKHQDFIDMELMRNCKHFIISNSTFSWWAAYLGDYSEKEVITPEIWYTRDYGENKPQLNLEGWRVLHID